ncbi:polyketide synthase dehydratase domain-containing protein, partial [Micromonospora arborensis]|uniref:polyketide synthase dehydratase domain-containing protein n=1 Tax=Micromonospora arborensis TaxID=2116518 RepID=UPI0033FF0B1E
ELFTAGATVDWPALFDAVPATRVDLPTYAFQRQRYWLAPVSPVGDVSRAGLGVSGHPLLGAAVSLADGSRRTWTGWWTLDSQPWLADHSVLGSPVVVGAVWAELALHAGAEVGAPVVEELVLHTPLVLPERGGVQVQISVGQPDGNGNRELKVHARDDADPDSPWTEHALAVLSADRAGATEIGYAAWPPTGALEMPLDGMYDRLAERGYQYGPAFRGLRRAWRHGDDLLAEVGLPEPDEGFLVHPALLDAALHAVLAAADEDAEGVALPFTWNGISLTASGADFLRVRLSPRNGGGVSVTLADGQGAPVGSVGSVVSRPVSTDQLTPPTSIDSLYAV